jgi:hypothetical protein
MIFFTIMPAMMGGFPHCRFVLIGWGLACFDPLGLFRKAQWPKLNPGFHVALQFCACNAEQLFTLVLSEP